MRWNDEGTLDLIDQRLLPKEETWVQCRTPGDVGDAIREMVVRGAPAIGITAAYGMALAAGLLVKSEMELGTGDALRGGITGQGQRYMQQIFSASELLIQSRPTAVNLEWAVKIQLELASELVAGDVSPADLFDALLTRAHRMHEHDIECNRRIGEHGAGLLRHGDSVLTHCNAGALATGGFGTALGVIRFAHEAGMNVQTYATETRPFLQGARLTAWELIRDGIPVRLIVDSSAGMLMSRGEIDAVVVGADRVAANGDVANKIGTYQLALAAAANSIPFYVAVPMSTIDYEVPGGSGIEIELRSPTEVLSFNGQAVAPDMAEAVNYAFDITPAELVTGIVTEHGVVERPFERGLKAIAEINDGGAMDA